MKILFVIADIFYSEPLGVLQLSAICKGLGYQVALCVLAREEITAALERHGPEVVGYSVMSADEALFIAADHEVMQWQRRSGRRVVRLMGGPHPTYFPEILDRLSLDAIVRGDGDLALPLLLTRIERREPLSGIPNVMTPGSDDFEPQVVTDLDRLPFPDRALFYEYDPRLLQVGLRAFQSQRGCPFKCAYCFNPSYNALFIRGKGYPLLRRRSVDRLIAEIQEVRERYPVLRFVRFSDDVFVVHQDAWLEEFADKYPRLVGIPFYCLVSPQSMTEGVVKLLAKAGCRSVGSNIESGIQEVRRTILKRNLSDHTILEAYQRARRYGILVIGNAMMAIPGTTLEDDFQTFLFSKRAKPAYASFGIFCPYPRTGLTAHALEMGLLDQAFSYSSTVNSKTVLNNYTEAEKDRQMRLCHLAPLFCRLPDFMVPVLRGLIRLPFDGLYALIHSLYDGYNRGIRLMPGARPRSLRAFLHATRLTLNHLMAKAPVRTILSPPRDGTPMAEETRNP